MRHHFRIEGAVRSACLALAVVFAHSAAYPDELQVNTDAGTAYQGYSACATDALGSVFVVWEDGRNGGVDIFLQRFDRAGARLGMNVRVNSVTAPDQYAPSVACDAAGNGWIAWQDFRASGYPYNGDIYLQRIGATGLQIGANSLVNDDGSEATQKEPAIAIGPAAVLIAWSDLRNGQWEIQAQLYDLDGLAIGANFVVSSSRVAAQHAPSTAALPDSTFVVAWYDARTGDDDVYAQRVRGASPPVTPDLVVDRAGDGRTQRFPAVATRSAGGFCVVWEDFRTGSYPSGGRVFRRDFNEMGDPIDTSLAVWPSSHDQRRPRNSGDQAGNRVAVWEEERDGIWSVFGRKYTANDQAESPAVEAGSAGATAARSRPQIAIGAGKIFYTWSDLRRGNFDIYLAVETYRFPSFVLNPQAITFAVPLHAPELTAAAVVGVSATGAVPVQIDWVGIPPWMTVTPESAATPAEFSFRIVALPVTDTVVALTARDAKNPAIGEILAARLGLLAPTIELAPQRVDLEVESVAESLLVLVSNAVEGPLQWACSAPGPPWLVRQAGADALWIIFDPTGHAGDSVWLDTVWFSDSLATNSPLALPLFARTPALPPAPPYLVASPSELFWSARVGEATADSAVLTVAANRDTSIAWSLIDWPSWLYVSTADGSTPASLVARAARDYQPLGTYCDTLEIWSPDASNSPLAVPVTLQVDMRSDVRGEVPESEPTLTAYPNPFNSSVLVKMVRSVGGPSTMRVVDRLGRTVDRLAVPDGLEGTSFTLKWTPSSSIPSGPYFLSLEGESEAPAIRVLYLK